MSQCHHSCGYAKPRQSDLEVKISTKLKPYNSAFYHLPVCAGQLTRKISFCT